MCWSLEMAPSERVHVLVPRRRGTDHCVLAARLATVECAELIQQIQPLLES